MASASASKGGSYDFLIKLLLIGDSGVGKSCLLLRYCEDSFTTTFITTIGIDFKIKSLEIGGKKIKLQVWDTAGQERFRTITTAYYRGAMGILLVYDIGDRESFDHVRDWMRQIEVNAQAGVVKMLIGNKSDTEDRAVSEKEGKALAAEYEIPFFETSAKTNTGVEEAFEAIATIIKDRLVDEPPKPASVPVPLTAPKSSSSGGCC
eukprot:PLAT6473.4.p1 GENE.PLAT6473.4~~PLAT6473.4.p1  ORF type:complete len:206 (-),score=52.54 PLAT6473.4:125-742(-)